MIVVNGQSGAGRPSRQLSAANHDPIHDVSLPWVSQFRFNDFSDLIVCTTADTLALIH